MPNLVRHVPGGWAQRRASAAGKVGPLPERHLGCPGCALRRGWGSEPQLVDVSLPGPSARRPGRVALTAARPLPTHIPQAAEARWAGPDSGLGTATVWEALVCLSAPSPGPTRAGPTADLQGTSCGSLTNFQGHVAECQGLKPPPPFPYTHCPALLSQGQERWCKLLVDAPRPLVWWGLLHPQALLWHGDL